MTEGDIKAKFQKIAEDSDYLLSGAFIKLMVETICRTNPIGPWATDLGSQGTYIQSTGINANVVFCVNNGNGFIQETGQFVNGLMITLSP